MNTQNSISEWELWMVGQIVNTIVLDFSLTLLLHKDDEDCALRVETPFNFSIGNEVFILNPTIPCDMSKILCLLGKELGSVQIKEEGYIVVRFDSGECISVGFDMQYESWQVSDKNSKVSVICLPGGGLG